MTIEYEYHRDKCYVLCKVDGQVALKDVLNYIDKIIDDPIVDQPYFEIVVVSKSANLDFGYYQTPVIMGRLSKLKKLKNYQGSLFIMNSDMIRGMSNIFKVVGEDQSVDIKKFENLEAAVGFVTDYFS